MLDDLTLMVGSIFDLLTSIFNLYTGTMVLTGVLALWLLLGEGDGLRPG